MKNIGIVGYGFAGRKFHAYLIGLAEGLNVSAVVTRDETKQQTAAQDLPSAKVYSRPEELFADDEIDAVVLATPHDTHRDLAVQAMEAGKHVVTDKVMCMDAEEAAEMIEASRRCNVILSVFQNRRWDWDFLTLQKTINDGAVGTPYLLEAAMLKYGKTGGWRGQKARSGGILYDWGAHFIDQALQLVQSKPVRVFCDIKDFGMWNVDIGNYGRLEIFFENDVQFNIDIGNLAAFPKPRWYVLGDYGGFLKTTGDPQEPAMLAGNIDAAEEKQEDLARVVSFGNGEREEKTIDSVRGSWKAYYQNISEVLNSGVELAVKPEETYQDMLIFDAAMESARIKEPVTPAKPK